MKRIVALAIGLCLRDLNNGQAKAQPPQLEGGA